MRKLRFLWHSDPANAPSGFGAYSKYILSELYKTGKYEFACYGCGLVSNDPNIKKFPWKSYPAIPVERQDIITRANQDPNFGRALSYGAPLLDEVIRDFKPDVYIGVQDFWGFEYAIDSKWWDKINSISHWTADSLPLLQTAIDKAPRIKHHYVWTNFAEKEFHRLGEIAEKKGETEKAAGLKRVKTLSGCVNENAYRRLSQYERDELREKHNLKDTFIITTGSRNQLRKLFPEQIEAFSIFKRQNPGVKTKLIHWCSQSEGWNLVKHCEEYGISTDDVLIAYRCRATGEIFYLPVGKEDQDNPKIPQKGTLKSVGMDNYATEEQINEFLNLSDVFMLCITSGGFELWLSQAKLTECPTLANSYSCFEEQVGFEKGTLEVDQSFTHEIQTGFKKASVFPSSIAKQLKRVYDMDEKKRRELGKLGRDFVLKNYSIEVVAKQWEQILDSMPLYEGTWDLWVDAPANLNAPIQNIPDNEQWIRHLYKNILAWKDEQLPVPCPDVDHWVKQLNAGLPRDQAVAAFRHAGEEHNKKLPNNVTPEQIIREAGVKEDAVLVVFKESGGDIVLLTSLFRSLKEQYPNNQLVISCEPKFRELLEGNGYLDLIVNYQPWMDQQLLMQGIGTNKPLVFKSLHPRCGAQMNLDYLGKDNINLNLKYNKTFEIIGYQGFLSPGIPPWAEKLPEKLDIGRRVYMTKGYWKGRKGTINNHFINSDDCAGAYGKEMYSIENDKKDVRPYSSFDFSFTVRGSDDSEFEFID